MTTVGWLPAPVEELFGTDATAEESYEVLTVDVPPSSWLTALETARDRLTCTYFDWLSAVDEPGTGFRVAAHVVALSPVRRLLLRTTVPHEAPALPSAVGVYAGAAWHERETHEMFGVDFEGHPALDHLLLPETFEGHPLRKDFVLAARVAKAWPGAKEPGESEHGGPKRRQMLPPGVPDPNEWGPLKGQLPPAPARPTRAPARAAGERPARAAGERPVRAAGERPVRAAGERPARRMRSAAEGSASQAGGDPEAGAVADTGAASAAAGGGAPGARPRRARSAAQGSVSQTAAGAENAGGRAASTGEGSATTADEARAPADAAQAAADVARTAADASDVAADAPRTTPSPKPATTPRSPDAPWHHARPAFEEPDSTQPPSPEPAAQRDTDSALNPDPDSVPQPGPDSVPPSESAPDPEDRTPDTRSPEDPEGGKQ
ncbi:NADH-quinone oxidoreductase subunit C [Streptomyces sp. SLBN-31]|uniref:NADH-quinone oxidoreductase subunit C n=1 Tax=Streptomyces sp. SLBN-31 TaxID=2768444 RepID=UPI00114D581A|nr:NADH-quinone oxidoreductase subunit C [Streptomyces sp. SLBN-31]TQJ89291.1 NADH dehydrogenase subunit C [Streptomyces sp. SLBN-31]